MFFWENFPWTSTSRPSYGHHSLLQQSLWMKNEWNRCKWLAAVDEWTKRYKHAGTVWESAQPSLLTHCRAISVLEKRFSRSKYKQSQKQTQSYRQEHAFCAWWSVNCSKGCLFSEVLDYFSIRKKNEEEKHHSFSNTYSTVCVCVRACVFSRKSNEVMKEIRCASDSSW